MYSQNSSQPLYRPSDELSYQAFYNDRPSGDYETFQSAGDRQSFQSVGMTAPGEYQAVDKSRESYDSKVHLRQVEETLVGKRSRVCGCFSTRRSCCTTFCSIFILLLVGLGITAYFAYPRMPNVKIGNPYVDQNSPDSLSMSGSPQTASPASPFQISFGLFVDVSAVSQNYIDWALNFINIDAQIVDANNKPFPSTSGTGRVSNVNIKSFANTTITLVSLILMQADKSLLHSHLSNKFAEWSHNQEFTWVLWIHGLPANKHQIRIHRQDLSCADFLDGIHSFFWWVLWLPLSSQRESVESDPRQRWRIERIAEIPWGLEIDF